MRSLRWAVATLCLAIAVGLGITAWNLPLVRNSTDAVQVSRDPSDMGVDVSVTRARDELLDQPGIGRDLAALKGQVLPFAIAVDTHMGDISHLDLNGKVFLKDSAGIEIPGMVKQLSIDEHHTSYVAVFPKQDSYGKSLDGPGQQNLVMVVKEVGGVPQRVLQWNPAGSPGTDDVISGLHRLATGIIALAAVLGGFLALLSPCVLHTTWYWASLVAGSSTQQEIDENRLPILRAGVVKAVLLFIAGFSTMYVVLGTIAGAVGSIASRSLTARLTPYKLVLDIIAGLLITMFGLHVTGLFEMKWLQRFHIPLPKFLRPNLQSTQKPAAFTMGLSMAFGCVSCVGGTVFLGLLAYLGTTTWYTGLQVSVLYSIGVAMPLLFLTLGLDRWLSAMRRSKYFRQVIAVASGAMLIGIGVLTMIGRSELAEAGAFWVVGKLGLHLPGSIR